MTGNKELAKKRWQDRFYGPFRSAVAKDLEPVPADTSPIMQAIQSIAVQHFIGDRTAALPKRLVIVSDLIEHEADYSQYRGDLTFDRFKKSSAYRKYRTDLNDAVVTIEYVQRQRPPIDGTAHVLFWRDWITDNNGDFGSVQRLQGVN